MKRATVRLLSALLVIVMVIGLVPMTALHVSATENAPTITVGTASGRPGATVDVPVSIVNNSGIISLNVSISYDSSKLGLTGVTNGTVLSDPAHSGSLSTNPYRLCFAMDLSPVNITSNGVIATLTFVILDEVEDVDVDITVNYNPSEIYDVGYNDVHFEKVNGKVTVCQYVSGDVNSDGDVNAKDVTRLRRYLGGGWPAPDNEINNEAANCNGDSDVNAKDVTRLRRYLAGGWANDSVLSNGTQLCATGHTVVIDAAVEPTYDRTGLTEGKHCSVCNKVIVAQTVIPALQRDEYAITYHIDNNDAYLKSLNIENPNPPVYTKQEGLVLQDLLVDGYNFAGWYTASVGGDKVTQIPAGGTGNKTFYARWGKIVYTIQFASDMVPVPDMEYTVGVERTLPKPTLDKYTFTGWGDENGTIWKTIPKGMTGDIILYSNWVSNRNKATAEKNLDKPVIVEDSDAGLILFTYEIGQIDRVPLAKGELIQTASGIITTVSETFDTQISSTEAKGIAQTISKATTNSASWTLSSDWNNTTQVSEKYLNETQKTREEAETIARSSSNTYNLSSSSGGSASSVAIDDTYSHVTNNKGTVTVNENEQKHSVGVEVSASVPLGPVKLGAKASYGYENNSKTTGTDTDMTTAINEGYKSNTEENNKYWNSSSSYSSSNSTSNSRTVSDTLTEIVSEEYGYGKSYAEGGSNSETKDTASTNAQGEEYSSALTYYTSQIRKTTREYKTTGNTKGSYRVMLYGKVHVFAVVGYDIANKAYFVNTYNILDEHVYEDLDYSYNDSFTDYELSYIPFEVPYFVNEYVDSRIAVTDGFTIDPDTGMITKYNPNPENPDNLVFIPSYMSIDNNDGTFSSVKVTGIAPDLFRNNTDIVGVQFGSYITEIPDSAFEGCSSLEYIVGPNITKIGNNAFSGCISLKMFTLPEDITELGTNAFKGVPRIKAAASNADVAQAVASSGADVITLDISCVPQEESYGMEFNIGEITFFELQGKDKEYKGLSIKSDAATTVINGVTFTENKKIPMELSSANVTLDRVTADSSGFALVLKAGQTNVKLNRTVNLRSVSENALLCRNVSFAPLNTGIAGRLNVSGNVLVCGSPGSITGGNDLTVTNGKIIYITDKEFENYLSSRRVYFDATGGTVDPESKQVAFSAAMGELPTPSRDHYIFSGWYTEKEGGEQITSKTIMTALTDITIYAHWIENKHCVHFNSNNGSAVSSLEVMDGKLVPRPANPTRANYTFQGWYKDPELTIPWDFSNDKVYGETTLYAKWEIIVYTITFNSNGGTAVSPVQVNSGEKIPKPANPTRDRHQFLGWFKDYALTQEWNFSTEVVTSDMPLYAKWKVTQVDVTLTNYGSGGSNNWIMHWSDIGEATHWRDISYSRPAGLYYCYVHYGGWSYGDRVNVGLFLGSTQLKEPHYLAVGPGANGFTKMATYDAVVTSGATQALSLRLYRIDSTQGGIGTNAQVMFVDLEPLKAAIGRDPTAEEFKSWFGTDWTGSKTVTINLN